MRWVRPNRAANQNSEMQADWPEALPNLCGERKAAVARPQTLVSGLDEEMLVSDSPGHELLTEDHERVSLSPPPDSLRMSGDSAAKLKASISRVP